MSDTVAKLRTSSAGAGAAESEEHPAMVTLGGTRVYAPDFATLEMGLKCVSEAIRSGAGKQSCITSNYLLHLCRSELNTQISLALYRACLGVECRLGNIERCLCRSEKGATFRIVVASERLTEFRSQLCQVLDLSLQTVTVRVRQVQDLLFPSKAKGTWFVATLILQRLAYLGFLEQVDKWTLHVPELLLNVQTEINGKFVTPNASRLA